jgi:hypothetical protein
MWFTENPWPPMLLAGLGSLVCFGLWNSDRRNIYFILGLLLLAMTGVIYVVERAIVTEGEKLQLQVALLCDQFRKRDMAALDHFSSTAPELKATCTAAMHSVEIGNDLRLTDFSTKFMSQNSQANVHFRANATITVLGTSKFYPFRGLLTFRKEGGAWKIVDVQRLDPIKGDKIGIMDAR